jgi:hypothetical protein
MASSTLARTAVHNVNELFQAKAQHYIPRFYLKGFTDKVGALWVYEKFKPLRMSKPKHEAHRPDYYTHAEEGERDETAEDMLKKVESQVAPIILKLANPQYMLTPKTAGDIVLFVAFMFTRVPSWREHLDRITIQISRAKHLDTARDKQKFYKLCSDMEKSTGKPLGMDYEKLRQYVLKGEYEFAQTSKAFNLGAMFTSALSVIEQLMDYNGYQILYAPRGKFFMSSDSPVYILQPDGNGEATIGMGFGWPGVEVYCPLNKRACLRMKKGLQPKSVFIMEGHADQINRVIMATATRYLYSCERYKRIERLFNERGCKVRPGKESFLSTPPSEHGRLF